MATGTNGIATIGELISGKGLDSPAGAGWSNTNQCPTKNAIITHMHGSVSGTYSSNQLVKYSDVSKAPNGVLFTVTIDNKKSNVAANLNIAYRFSAAPGYYAFATGRRVGYTSSKGVTNHNTGPFDTAEIYGNSNVLFWSGPVGFSYSYSAIVGTSGITYSSAGSGTYNGTNQGPTGNNLEYITLFSQSIQHGDSISLTITIN